MAVIGGSCEAGGSAVNFGDGEDDDSFGDGDNCGIEVERKARSRSVGVNKNYSHYIALSGLHHPVLPSNSQACRMSMKLPQCMQHL
jgi:hypothetical protein